MRVVLGQINPTIGDLEGNARKIIDAIKQARKDQADLIVFPELALSGYPPEDFLLMPHFIEACEHKLGEIIPHCINLTAVVGMPRRNPNREGKYLYNSAAVIQNMCLLGFQDKILLPTYDVFDELRFFEPGEGIRIWNLFGKQMAVTICEDIWQHSTFLQETHYKRNPVKEIEPYYPDVVVNLSSSPFHVGKLPVRIEVCRRAAKTLMCPLLLCNQVGGNDSLIFDGYSLYMDAKGNLLGCAKGFVEDYLLIDLEAPAEEISVKPDDNADLYNALVLGLKDYFRKSNFTKACFGLSGGIDSALVACIAVEALGAENVLAVMMPSRYSSKSSVIDAIELAKNLGIVCKEIPIEAPFSSFLSILAPQFKDHAPDVTEENLQARIRGTLLMALSNKLGYIVLSTGNKSELAMGYSTLYGDMVGGLGVISDLTKKQVYSLARWINRPKEIIPQNILDKAPSAELRPNQKDSDSLPDYSIVDEVLKEYVEEHCSPEEIARKNDYPLELVQDLIKRIHRNEYKRRQGAPGLRISEKAFSVGRRFPIVQRFVS